MSRAWLLVVVPALLLPCCANFGLADEEVTPAKPDAGDGATPSADGASPLDGTSPEDGGGTGDADAGADASACNPACKGTVAPCGIPITTAGKTFCIDPTEVTVAQYRKFLATEQGKVLTLPAPCGETPIVARQVRPDDQPITNVTWCEAAAYYRWAGKRLCGSIEGKALGQADYATQSAAWYHACTGGTAGHKLIGATPCRFGSGAPLASGTTCEGGYPGVFDMP